MEITIKVITMIRLYKTIMLLAFVTMSSNAIAQTLSVQPIEVKAGEQAAMTVNISQPSDATALQFNLQLPIGVTINESNCTLGNGTNGHTLSVNRMDSGDYLFVLYQMDFQTFSDGTLLTIPITIANDAKTGNGKLYTVRSSKSDAVSLQKDETTFTITVSEELAKIENVKTNVQTPSVFNLNGQRLELPRKGINIVSGKKVVVK